MANELGEDLIMSFKKTPAPRPCRYSAETGRKGARVLRGALLTGTVLSAVLAGPNAFGESLEEALVSAYNTNPTLLAERHGVKATGESVWQARAGWQPTVTLQGSTGTQETTTQPGDVETSNDPKQASATITQPIFRGGQTYFGTRSAQAQTRAAKAGLVATEQSVLFGAVQAYYNVMRDKAVVTLSQNNVQVLERQLEASQDRFRVGEITRTDVAQAEARLSGARSRLTQTEAALIASRSSYEKIIGHMPSDLGMIEEQPTIENLPETEEEAIALALQANPALQAAEERELASRDAVNATRGALLPQVSVTASYSYGEDTSSVFEESETTSVTGRVTIPLYQGGATYSRLRQAKQTNSQNRIQIAETERAVREQVINAWEGLRSARATIQSSEEQVRANEIAFNGVKQEAQVGSRTTLDVLNAEQELLDARVTLVRARRDEKVAAYALLSAVGRLTAKELALPVTIYQP